MVISTEEKTVKIYIKKVINSIFRFLEPFAQK